MDRTLPLTIKTSPLVFVKRLIIIEIISFSIIALLRFLYTYDPFILLMPFELPQPSSFLLTLSFTILQALVIIVSFVTWYTERYIVNRHAIVYKRGDFFHEREIAQLNKINTISVEQSTLGRWFNYGTLMVRITTNNVQPMGNIPNPERYSSILMNVASEDYTKDITNVVKPKALKSMLSQGEGKSLEYKSSFQWDYKQNDKNKDLQKAVMKTVVAFMNSEGGIVIVGVDDKRNVLGLKQDYKLLKKKNSDGFENSFTMSFKKMIGDEHRHLVDVQFKKSQSREVAVLVVQASNEPVFLTYQDDEEFYIRAGNSSQPLSIRQATTYIKSHFPS